ncbi:ARM repeat-containing protein [Teratosphaeria nubilosa]|uniref:ARM repeat-containing protein n=1 Tax=Teratosphaeria nubilosa TaxID=161662 RepID=A0A6G1LGF9_9PEZI|nr:ARM repeat-containing protein [Teratosphaeria nubilosa]
MDAQASSLLSTLKRPAAPSNAKLDALNALKSDIKHCRVPETAQATIFDCLKLAIAQQVSSTLALSAFSTLGHLIKRLKIQDATGHAIVQLAPRLFPALQERLGDLKEPIRSASAQALRELYPWLKQDVETIILDDAIGGSNARAKEAGMQWVVRMHRDESMPFKAYTQAIVARLEDSDGTVREAAKTAVVDLFSNAPDRAKTDLKRQLKAHSVRHSIQTQILAQIGADGPPAATSRPQTRGEPEADPDLAASTRSLPAMDHIAHFAQSINSDAAKPPPQEVVPMDPVFVHSERELHDIFEDMLPFFQGREDEDNWIPRDKAVTKVRRLLKGNALTEHHHAFMAGVKSILDGVLKVANSLRTTLSTNGCQLVQELTQTLGPAMDPHVEVLLQNFIKMSSQTKPIAAQHGRTTCEAVFQHCSYHKGMMQHIWIAAQEKNAQTRQCVPEWLRTILKRQAGYKQHFESTGGLDLAEKCIKKGLEDPKPTVKEATRATYWTFAKSWPVQAEKIMASLDNSAKNALQKDLHNPNAALHGSQTSSVSASARPHGSRVAMRDLIAQQRKAKAGNLPSRPSSAMAELSPAKPRAAPTSANRAPSRLRDNRIASNTSNVSETPSDGKASGAKRSALMSGPVRRPRRPEIARPQTADPYASRRNNLLRPETPADASPSNSPPKGTTGSKASAASSTHRSRARTAANATSPGASPGKRSPGMSHAHPPAESSSRPTSKGSLAARGEEDFTMVLPNGKSSVTSSRGGFVPTHKRPGLGQTMSVDSGIPAEDEGFTMVMPNLPNHQPRARSPLAVRSPLKAMFDEARDKLERSASPPGERLNGIDEALAAARSPRSASPNKAQALEIPIYEDPFTADGPEAPSDGERKVLGELPANENVRVQSPTQSQGSSASPAGSPRHEPEVPVTNGEQSAQDRAEILRSKRLLGSGIERIRTKTLDAHGFRRVQDLVRSKLDIWEGGKKYDELMTVLLDYLQTFEQDPRLTQPGHKAAGLKTQALGLVRALLTLQRKSAQGWQPKALVTIFTCRKGVDPNTHMVTDIDKAADDIVRQSQPESCIDATLDYLSSHQAAPRSTAMALTTLRRLLEAAAKRNVELGSERKVQLTQAAARYLDDVDAEVRKADVELASDLFALFGTSKAEFWAEFKGTDEGRLGLLTYYIARRGREGRVEVG